MKKIIYHGSKEIIKKPKKEKGKINIDYGQVFYFTFDIELAIALGVSMSDLLELPTLIRNHYKTYKKLLHISIYLRKMK